MKMGHHATEAPKKIMVITIMQRGTVELPALRDYAKKGRIFIKVYMVYHVKLLKIEKYFFSFTWATHVISIFNIVMIVFSTLFLGFFLFFFKCVGSMLFHIKLNSGRSHRGSLPMFFIMWLFSTWTLPVFFE